MFVLMVTYVSDVLCSNKHVSYKEENDINRYRNTDSPIAVTTDGFDTVFVGTDKRILMISPDKKVLRYDRDSNSDNIHCIKVYEYISFLI